MPAPLSIIIPTLNEEADLAACLQSLMVGLDIGLIREVIVVDGGSNDRSMAIAEEAGARVLQTSRGRGQQLMAGADAARGVWLMFIHADTVLTADWPERILVHMETQPERAAAFTLVYRSDAPEAKWLARRANQRSRWFGLPYGDQGLVMTRRLYDRVGGFKPMPLFEDVDLVRRLGRRRMRLLSAQARTSAAKYEAEGWRRRSWRNAWLILRYFMGGDPAVLLERYDREAAATGDSERKPAEAH